jgi:hypothetical protein
LEQARRKQSKQGADADSGKDHCLIMQLYRPITQEAGQLRPACCYRHIQGEEEHQRFYAYDVVHSQLRVPQLNYEIKKQVEAHHR